jgi:ABC-type glycerol-3-phosphate transport system permease component
MDSQTAKLSLIINRKARFHKIFLLILNYFVMILIAAFFLFPFWVMVVASLKPEKQIFDDLKSVTWAFIPRNITIENYAYIFDRIPFLTYLKNTIVIILSTIFSGLIVNSMIAFALARLRWGGKKWIIGFSLNHCAPGDHRSAFTSGYQSLTLVSGGNLLAGQYSCPNHPVYL